MRACQFADPLGRVAETRIPGMSDDTNNAKSLSIIVTKGSLDWAMAMPNMVAMLPGVEAGAAKMMKNLTKKKGVASIEELREAAVESDVRMIGCQMTMDLFEYSQDEMIEGIELGGAATYLETAINSDINLFI
jgi:peroxiredoxin family protein